MAKRRRHPRISIETGQPVTRSLAALAAWKQSGAGFHGKSRKSQRRAERVKLQKGDH
jgi:hypothetical protein